jgi:hypothetical protein
MQGKAKAMGLTECKEWLQIIILPTIPSGKKEGWTFEKQE